jgi:peptidylprolyl isomerase
MYRRSFFLALAGLAVAASRAAAQAINLPANLDRENALVIETPHGPVVIRLRPDLAPNHVERLKTLARRGFYNNVPFHRVIEGFMAQTGDGQRGDGTGGSDLPNLRAEFSREPFRRGTVGMARTSEPHTANAQFFICFADASHLNGQYTVVGEVISGMEAVDRLKRGVGAGGTVPAPADRMIRVRVAADIR